MNTREPPRETGGASRRNTGSTSALRGVLVVGANGQQVAALGVASRGEFASVLQDRWQEARDLGQAVFLVDDPLTEAKHVVVALASTGSTVLAVLKPDQRDALIELVASVEFSGEILEHLLTNPFEALTVVDRAGVLRYISPVHEKFFGIAPGAGTGRHVTQVIENTRLHTVASTGKSEVGSIQPMKGVSRVVSRHPVLNRDGEVVGALGQVMFKGPEQLEVMSAELKRLQTEVAFYRREISSFHHQRQGLDHIVGTSPAIERLKRQIAKVASMDIPVLLTGESGTGKELAAHAIHLLSTRRDENMVTVNAAALPASLVESELFGYEGGAFTGAEKKGRRGKIEKAHKGSLFFDEVGDMPSEVQVKLLRVLQDGSFERVGSHEPRHSRFRLISASNRDFEQMIAAGTFRLDLFYRISAVTIRLPALRERTEDIPLLAAVALQDFATRHAQPTKRLSSDSIAFLQQLDWPGNVRQLMHVVERAAIFSENEVIEPPDFGVLESTGLSLPGMLPPATPAGGATPPAADAAPRRAAIGVRQAVGEVEEQLIRAAMEKCRGNKKQAAAELGISRSYLYKRLGELGIT